MHRTKAIKEHGGEDGGKEAFDDMVAAGIYEEKTVMAKSKEGKTIKIEFARVVEAETSESKEQWLEGKRTGAAPMCQRWSSTGGQKICWLVKVCRKPEQPEPPKGKQRNAIGFGG